MNELHFLFSEMLLPFCPMFVRKVTNLKSYKTHITTKAHCVVPTRINAACENVWEPTCPLTITVCNQSIARQSPFFFFFGSQFIFWFTGIIWRLSGLNPKNTVCRTQLHVSIVFLKKNPVFVGSGNISQWHLDCGIQSALEYQLPAMFRIEEKNKHNQEILDRNKWSYNLVK